MHESHGYYMDLQPLDGKTNVYTVDAPPNVTYDQIRELSTPKLVRAWHYYMTVAWSDSHIIKPFARNRHSIIVDVLKERGVLD